MGRDRSPGGDHGPFSEAELKAIAAYLADYLGVKPEPGLPQLYTQKEVAEALAVSERTLETLVAMGELPVARVTPGKRGRRFERSAVDDFVRRNSKTS